MGRCGISLASAAPRSSLPIVPPTTGTSLISRPRWPRRHLALRWFRICFIGLQFGLNNSIVTSIFSHHSFHWVFRRFIAQTEAASASHKRLHRVIVFFFRSERGRWRPLLPAIVPSASPPGLTLVSFFLSRFELSWLFFLLSRFELVSLSWKSWAVSFLSEQIRVV